MGKYISDRLSTSEWGQKTIEQLAAFIQTQETGIKGFEKRNLYRMRQFYETYPDSKIVSALLTQLSWTHHSILISRCKTGDERLFYLQLSTTERYSTRELDRQINSGIFERTRLADAKLPQTNHPKPLTGVFRDSYVLDFLNLPLSHSENDLKTALVACLRDFILELGQDFTFLGQEYRLQVGNSDFFIDFSFSTENFRASLPLNSKSINFSPNTLHSLNSISKRSIAISRSLMKIPVLVFCSVVTKMTKLLNMPSVDRLVLLWLLNTKLSSFQKKFYGGN